MPSASRMDMIDYMNKHINSEMGDRVPSKERAKFLYDILAEFHTDGCPSKRKHQIATEVIREVFFLCVKNAGGKTTPMTRLDDVLSLMVQNVIQAIENFDPALNTKFSSFLRGYLKNAISTAYRDTFIIKHPYRPRMAAIKRMREIQEEDTKIKLTPEEREKILNECMAQLTPEVKFMDDLPEGTEPIVDSELPHNCSEAVDALDCMLEGEKVYLLAHILAHGHPLLSTKEKMVVKHRFGVFGHEKLTLEEVAEKFHSMEWNATKEWIFQLEKRALEKIQAHFKLYAL